MYLVNLPRGLASAAEPNVVLMAHTVSAPATIDRRLTLHCRRCCPCRDGPRVGNRQVAYAPLPCPVRIDHHLAPVDHRPWTATASGVSASASDTVRAWSLAKVGSVSPATRSRSGRAPEWPSFCRKVDNTQPPMPMPHAMPCRSCGWTRSDWVGHAVGGATLSDRLLCFDTTPKGLPRGWGWRIRISWMRSNSAPSHALTADQ